MESKFRAIQPEKMTENVFKLIGSDWMLITAGTLQKFNAMTASWGGLGVLWQKNVCFCVIRPQRFTFEFVENADHFTLSFFDQQYRDILNYYGTKSGRDVDKMKGTGITPEEGANGTVHFQEAQLFLECRKIYLQDLDHRNFLDPAIDGFYPAKDYHRMFIGEIAGCYTKSP